jgi:hypothetical protein
MRTLPFTRRQLRRCASLTLFGWVFALLSATLNACLVPASPTGDLRPGLSQVETMDEACDQHEHGSPAPGGAKAGCLKFCADEFSAVTPGKTSTADLALPVVVSVFRAPVAAIAELAAAWSSVERPASVGPPLFIRLVRMTT